MKHISDLPGAHSSRVELVEIDGARSVLKTADPEEVANEAHFQKVLAEAGLPALEVLRLDIPAGQILLEYVPGSPSIPQDLNLETTAVWGTNVRAMHHIHSAEASRIDLHGDTKSVDWNSFLLNELREAHERQHAKSSDLPSGTLQILAEEIKRMSLRPLRSTWSLLHADLHSNNVLIRGTDWIFFDKGSAIFFGDPLYDIATVGFDFPGGLLGDVQKEVESWNTFLQAYGLKPDDRDLWAYILLRAAGRYPNVFVPRLREICSIAMDRLNQLEQ